MSGNQLQIFKSNLKKMTDAKELALPSNVSEEAFRNAAIVAAQGNPDILSCTQDSLFKSIRTLAATGLVPDGREAALVPFYSKGGKICQAMPMVFGLIKMARRSGEVSDIRAHIVYDEEVKRGRFDYTIGDNETLTHSPILFGKKGDPVACYAVARLKDGTMVREFMSAEDIDHVRRSGASQRVGKGSERKVSDTPIGIWKDWWSEMWKKTVIRRLCKRLDLSSEDMRRVIESEPDFEHMRDVSPPDPGKFSERANTIRKSQEPQEPPQSEPEAPIEGEIVDDEPSPIVFEALDTESAFPGSEQFDEGVKAFEAGMKLKMCPYGDDEAKAIDWCGGFNMAQKAKGGE